MAVNHITYRGQPWTKYTCEPVREFFAGLDVGQSIDPSALAIIEYQSVPQPTYIENHSARRITQETKEYFDLRFLERIPIGTPYPEQVRLVAEIMARPPLEDCQIYLDRTGVGAPIRDLFIQGGLYPVSVLITGGDSITWHKSTEVSVPKLMLVSGLDARLATGELRFSPKLTDGQALANELKDFRRTLSEAGRSSFSATSGKHDDLLIATSLALFGATQGRKRHSGITITENRAFF